MPGHLNGWSESLKASWKRFRRRSRSTRVPYEGLVYLVILIALMCGALLGKSNMLLLVTSMMAGPWIVNLVLCYALLRNIDVRRRAPSRIMAGEPFSIEIVVHNSRRFLSSWVLVVADQLAHAAERLRPKVVFTRVPPGTDRSVHYQARLMNRGRYKLGPMRVSTQFPLGLAERVLVVQERGEVIVYPALGMLSPSWKRPSASAHELVQRTAVRAGSFDDEFHRLREYRSGDDPRAIHWRTSARQNELMVREYHQSREDDLTVLLDLWIPKRPSPEDQQRVEFAVSFAATIGLQHCRDARGCGLGLSILGRTSEHWLGLAGPFGIEPYLECLALTEAQADADLSGFVAEALPLHGEKGRCVLITTRPTSPPVVSNNGDGAALPGNPAGGDYGTAYDDVKELLNESATSRLKSNLELFEADPKKLAGLFVLDAGAE